MGVVWGRWSVIGCLVGHVASAASAPLPPSLPSDDPKLWRQRVSRWGDSLVGHGASVVSPPPPPSLLHQCMATSGHVRWFMAQAMSTLMISGKFLHGEGRSLEGLGASVVP
jgi:hypothetical protein